MIKLQYLKIDSVVDWLRIFSTAKTLIQTNRTTVVTSERGGKRYRMKVAAVKAVANDLPIEVDNPQRSIKVICNLRRV